MSRFGLVLLLMCIAACGDAEEGGQAQSKEDSFFASLKTCRVDDFSARVEGLGAVTYTILGRDDNDCRVEMVFIDNPNPSWVDQPLVMRLYQDRTRDGLKNAISYCIEGRQPWISDGSCEGPLMDVLGHGQAAKGLPIAQGDFSGSGCGTPYTGSAPARYRMRDKESGLWGFLDADGRWAITPAYTQAYAFSEGLAPVLEGETWHLIDTSGAKAIPNIGNAREQSYTRLDGQPIYSSPTQPFSENCARYTNRNGRYLLSRDGQLWMDQPSPAMAAAAEAAGGRVIDIRNFGAGLAAFEIDVEEFGRLDPKGYVNSTGEVAIEAQFARVKAFDPGSGLAPVGVAKGPDSSFSDGWIYINTAGEQVLPADGERYKDAEPFSSGIALVRTRAGRLYVDTEGTPISEDVYIYGQAFSDGIAFVDTKDYKRGWIDETGKLLFTTDDIGICASDWPTQNPFQDGLAIVLIEKDETGCGEGRATTTGGGASTFKNGEFAYVDKAGQIVFRESDISAP